MYLQQTRAGFQALIFTLQNPEMSWVLNAGKPETKLDMDLRNGLGNQALGRLASRFQSTKHSIGSEISFTSFTDTELLRIRMHMLRGASLT